MRLFIYGTLLEGLARGEAARLMEGIGPGQPARVSGALHLVEEELGCYPVLVPSLDGKVCGQIIECPDDPAWLADLDAYEGQDYRRWALVAELENGGEEEVQAYVCILPEADSLPAIPHGDFARYVANTGCRLFGA